MVETDHPRPVPWNFERFDDVRVQPVLVVRRVVRKLRKSLPVECVPFAQKQRFPQRLGLLFQLDDVVPRHMRIVHRRRRDVFNPPHAHLAEHAALHRRFGDALPRARRVHKSRFHPCVPRPAGVACASHAGRNAQPLFRAQPRPQVVIHGFPNVYARQDFILVSCYLLRVRNLLIKVHLIHCPLFCLVAAFLARVVKCRLKAF